MAEIIQVANWSKGQRASIVFIHGITGHAYDTWRRGRGDTSLDETFWPLWLAEDFRGASVFTVAYDAPTSRWFGTSMPLEDWATNIAESLLADDRLHAGPLVFVCHSLGGLILKRALLTLREQKDQRPEAAKFLQRVRVVIFAATPHTGSRQATLLGRLSLLTWPTPLATVLYSNSPTLRQINISYRTLAKDYQPELTHRVFFETLDTAVFRIVTEEAADPGLDAKPFGVTANHVDIVKPHHRTADLYTQITHTLSTIGDPKSEYGTLQKKQLPPVGRHRSPYFWPRLVRLVLLGLAATAMIVTGLWIWLGRGGEASARVTNVDEQAIRILVQNDSTRTLSPGAFRFEVTFPGDNRTYAYNLGMSQLTIDPGKSASLEARTINDTQAKYITPIFETKYQAYWEEFQRTQEWPENEVPTLEKLYRVFDTMSCSVTGELVDTDGSLLSVADQASCAKYQQFLRMNALQVLGT